MIVGLSLSLVLGACSPQEPDEPATSTTSRTPVETVTTEAPPPTPTEEPTTPSLEEQNIEAAKQTILDYHRAADEVGSEGFATWTEKLYFFWGSPEVSGPQGAALQVSADAGESTRGSTTIADIQIVEYVADPTGAGHERIEVLYCADYSNIEFLDSTGAIVPRTSSSRLRWAASMQHQDSGRWTFNKLAPAAEPVC